MAQVPVVVGYVSFEATSVHVHGELNPNLFHSLSHSKDESMEMLSSSPSPGSGPAYSPDHLSDPEFPPAEGEILPGGRVNTKSSYMVRVCMQHLKFSTDFFVMLRKLYFLPRYFARSAI